MGDKMNPRCPSIPKRAQHVYNSVTSRTIISGSGDKLPWFWGWAAGWPEFSTSTHTKALIPPQALWITPRSNYARKSTYPHDAQDL